MSKRTTKTEAANSGRDEVACTDARPAERRCIRTAGQRPDNATALYLEAIRDGYCVEAINTYAGNQYTHRSTPVKDCEEGFIEIFADFVRRNPTGDIQIIRGCDDGRPRYATADIFDTDDAAKLIEHWDVIEELRDTTESGRVQVDGPTEVSDLDETEAIGRSSLDSSTRFFSLAPSTACRNSRSPTTPSTILMAATASRHYRTSPPRRG